MALDNVSRLLADDLAMVDLAKVGTCSGTGLKGLGEQGFVLESKQDPITSFMNA